MRAELKLSISEPGIVVRALSADLRQKPSNVRESIQKKGKSVVINMESADLPSLQAALNSYLSLLKVTHKIKSGDANG